MSSPSSPTTRQPVSSTHGAPCMLDLLKSSKGRDRRRPHAGHVGGGGRKRFQRARPRDGALVIGGNRGWAGVVGDRNPDSPFRPWARRRTAGVSDDSIRFRRRHAWRNGYPVSRRRARCANGPNRKSVRRLRRQLRRGFQICRPLCRVILALACAPGRRFRRTRRWLRRRSGR